MSKLGRDLSKVVMIDNLTENFKSQPNNGLTIKTWTDDMNDNELVCLHKILTGILRLILTRHLRFESSGCQECNKKNKRALS